MAAAIQSQSQIIPKLIFQSLPAQSAHRGDAPPSHDISSAGYHVSQKALLLQLDLAVRAAWQSRHQSKYADVKVLMLSWESDDLGVEKEMSILKSVFQDAYNYDDVTHWKIPDKRPGHEASGRIARFLEQAGQPDNLLIVYYAGHAMPNVNHHGLPTWFANRQPNSPKFNSGMIQDYLCEVDDASPDVLFLYDTCHSANGHGSVESNRSAIALLAACGFESVAAEIGVHSFTYALIQELSDAARQQKAISVPQLHSSLLNRLHLQRQDVLLREHDGKMRICTTQDGIPLFELPVWRTPIHIQLSRSIRPRPIVLAPLPRKPKSTDDRDFITLNAQPPSMDTACEPKRGQMHVLLRVSLAEDSFNIDEFKEWICDAPEPAQAIKVVTTLPSCSTLVLLQMSVELWDMLPASPAIAFVGFVTVTEPTDPSGSPPDSTQHSSKTSPQGSVVATDTEPAKPSRATPPKVKKEVTFISDANDEKLTGAILDFVDSVLPGLFHEIRQQVLRDYGRSEDWILEQVTIKLEHHASLPAGPFGLEALSHPENVQMVKRYIGARYLLEHDNPLLNLTWRLNPLFSWRNYDAEAPDDQSTILTDAESTSTDHRIASSVFSDARTLDTALTSATRSSYTALMAHRNRPHLDGDDCGNIKLDSKERPYGGARQNTGYRASSEGGGSRHGARSGSPAMSMTKSAAVLERRAPKYSKSVSKSSSQYRSRPRRSPPYSSSDGASAVNAVSEVDNKLHDRDQDGRERDEDLNSLGSHRRMSAKGKGVDKRNPQAGIQKDHERAVPHVSATPDPPASSITDEAHTWNPPWMGNRPSRLDDAELQTSPYSLIDDYDFAPQGFYEVAQSSQWDPAGDEQDGEYYSGPGLDVTHDVLLEFGEPAYGVDATSWQGAVTDEVGVLTGHNELTAITAEQTNGHEQLDSRYKVQPSHKFVPGQVFKILWTETNTTSLWSEPLTERSSLKNASGQQFYVGFRRFIIVANDEGHSTCVPILTYLKQGCTKKGVKPAKHGIIHEYGTNPRLLRGEPELGFPPVRMITTVMYEKLAKESRVNYSKLVTVEHNAKVFFIGRIEEEDYSRVVINAVDRCWDAKTHHKPRASKRPPKGSGKNADDARDAERKKEPDKSRREQEGAR